MVKECLEEQDIGLGINFTNPIQTIRVQDTWQNKWCYNRTADHHDWACAMNNADWTLGTDNTGLQTSGDQIRFAIRFYSQQAIKWATEWNVDRF